MGLVGLAAAIRKDCCKEVEILELFEDVEKTVEVNRLYQKMVALPPPLFHA